MKSKFAFLSVLLTLLAFTACVEETDYSEESEQPVPAFLEDLKVPSGFDWATSKSVTLTVEAETDESYNGTSNYQIEILDENPIISANANLLAVGLVKSGQPFTTKLTIPSKADHLYIRQTNAAGSKKVRIVNITGDNIVTQTGVAAKAAVAKSYGMTKAAYTVPTIDYPTPTGNIVEITETSGDFTFKSKDESYVIRAGHTFQGRIFSGGYATTLYVEGTWINTGDNTNMNSVNVIFQNGSKYIASLPSSGIDCTGAKLIIASGAEFNKDKKVVNIAFQNTNGSLLINSSDICNFNNVTDVKEFYNYATMTITGTLSANSGDVNIINESHLTANKLSLNGKVNLYNNCLLDVLDEANFNNNVTLTVEAEKMFRSKKATFGSTSIVNLGSHAILDITELLAIKNTGCLINGPASGDKALARLAKLTIEAYNSPKFGGYLQIESSDYPPQRRGWETVYEVPNEAQSVDFVAKGASTINIKADECNSGGNGIQPETPVEIKYPITVTLGQTNTYAFEDNYPQLGDYDLNDMVIDVNLEYTLVADNKISDLTIKSSIRAVGASKRLAAAIQLDAIASAAVSSVSRSGSALGGDVFALNNGIESGQTYAVVPITDNAQSIFGVTIPEYVNTRLTDTARPYQVVTNKVSFKNPLDISQISLTGMLNVFIINGGYTSNNRKEVHLIDYKATDKATDVSAGKNFSSSNYIYAIRVPQSFSYPTEWTKITEAYPSFINWVTSGGSEDKDWYDSPLSDKVYQQIK